MSTIRNAHWRTRAARALQQFAESITKHRLGCLLVASWVWRVLLIYRGGPLSWPDDSRYFRTAALLEHIAAGRVSAAVDLLATSLDHWFFIVIGVPPALFQISVTKSITELSTLFGTPVSFSDDSTIWLAAAVLALGSVANIGLLHAIVRKLGGSPEAAFLAALFLACASSTLHLTRHLVPYETSLTFALWAIWVGVAREWRLRTSLLCGVLCALSFLTYNTYWITNLAVLLIHALRGTEWRFRLKRGLSVAVAFWVPLLLLSLASVSRGGDSLFSALSQLAASVTQGDYREGWSLPWAYFWHAEHGLLMLWAAGVLIVLWRWLRGGGAAGGIALVALLPPLITYGWLAVSSTMLHRLVVYARNTNQMVPFLCLAAGSAVAAIPNRRVRGIIVVLALVQTAFNFAPQYRLVFPHEVREREHARRKSIRDDVTIYGQFWHMNARGQQVFEDRYSQKDAPPPPTRYVLLNAGVLFLPLQGPKPPPPGRVVFRKRHMLSYLPYQYEAFNAAERAMLRSTDISMRLIDTKQPP